MHTVRGGDKPRPYEPTRNTPTGLGGINSTLFKH